jgi:hypothetical protein
MFVHGDAWMRSDRDVNMRVSTHRLAIARSGIKEKGIKSRASGKYRGPSLSCGISSTTAVWVIPAIGGNILAAEEDRLVWWSGAEV